MYFFSCGKIHMLQLHGDERRKLNYIHYNRASKVVVIYFAAITVNNH